VEQIYLVGSVWLILAVLSAVAAYHLRMSIALVEICVGVVAGAFATKYFGANSLGSNLEWLKFLASVGAVFLTFLAGAELDPKVIKVKWKEVLVVGLVGFLAPFLGCSAVAYYLLKWGYKASILSGVALSTTSMAVVYAVMLETGFNKTEFGKGILGSCFINDLGTVIALGLLFAPFTYKTLIFIAVTIVLVFSLPPLTAFFTNVRQQDRCDTYKMDIVRFICDGRSGYVVGKRSGASGLHRRDGACRVFIGKSRVGKAAALADRGLFDPVLFYQSRFFCFDTRVIFRSHNFSNSFIRQSGNKNIRVIPGNRAIQAGFK